MVVHARVMRALDVFGEGVGRERDDGDLPEVGAVVCVLSYSPCGFIAVHDGHLEMCIRDSHDDGEAHCLLDAEDGERDDRCALYDADALRNGRCHGGERDDDVDANDGLEVVHAEGEADEGEAEDLAYVCLLYTSNRDRGKLLRSGYGVDAARSVELAEDVLVAGRLLCDVDAIVMEREMCIRDRVFCVPPVTGSLTVL